MGNKIEVGRWLDDLTGSTFSVLTPAEYCTCFDVVIHYSLGVAIVETVRETLLLTETPVTELVSFMLCELYGGGKCIKI